MELAKPCQVAPIIAKYIMKKLFAILSIFAFVQVVSAQHLTAPVTISLNATYSTSNQLSATSDVVVYTEHTVHFTTASFLSLVGETSGLNLNGYTLVYDYTTGDLLATNHASQEGLDLTNYVQITQPNTVSAGRKNNATGAFDLASRGMMTISFSNSVGTSFVLTGLASVTTTQTPTTAVNTVDAYVLSLSCVGQGTYEGSPAFYTGAVTASGKIVYANY